MRHIVTCIGPNQKNQPNLYLYLVRRYTICFFPIVVMYICIVQNQKNQPNLVLYLVRGSKIFVLVATLPFVLSSNLIEGEGSGPEPGHHYARHEALPLGEPRHRDREGRQYGQVLPHRGEHPEGEDDRPQAA